MSSLHEVMATLESCCDNEVTISKKAIIQLLDSLDQTEARIGYNTLSRNEKKAYLMYTYENHIIECDGMFEITFNDSTLTYDEYQIFYSEIDDNKILIVSVYGDYRKSGKHNCLNPKFLVGDD